MKSFYSRPLFRISLSTTIHIKIPGKPFFQAKEEENYLSIYSYLQYSFLYLVTSTNLTYSSLSILHILLIFTAYSLVPIDYNIKTIISVRCYVKWILELVLSELM